MGPSKLRKAIGAVKDQTSIGLAKVGSSASLSDLDVAIVKATRHEEYPPDERHVREILNLTAYSRTFVSACVSTISRRLSRTSNWVVALKALMLVQRLLAEGDPAYEQEIFFATRRGTRLLNLCDFRDRSGRAGSWDYSAFVRTYALYLDEQLEFRMQGKRGKHGGYVCQIEVRGGGGGGAIVPRETPLRDMKNDRIFSRINHFMQLMDRFLHCKPAGAAREHRIVSVALYPIVKESFQLCYDITEIMAILIERFMELDIPEMVKVHDIFSRVSKQYDELDAFYTWCKTAGIARSSEYPEVEKISQKRLDMMDDYIHERSIAGPKPSPDPDPKPEPEPEPEEDLNKIKALPPPEEPVEEKILEENVEVEEPKVVKRSGQEEGDLLNLGEDAPSVQEHGDKLALALFDGGLATAGGPESKATPWEAFKESSASGDWETALIQSASHLSNQKVSLPGGFDTLILDGMYQQGAMNQAVASSGLMATGSASSVALGSAGRPAMLALPAPPSADQGGASNTDPFAASLIVPPPAYVQMSEMEKKRNFLVQEQVMWQQYERDGRQGPAALAKANPNSNPYNNAGGGYTGTYKA